MKFGQISMVNSCAFQTGLRTKIIRVSPFRPEIKLIRIAARVIRRGGTVAFPTETVYGLGSDALNPEAALKIFKAKNRPADNPIIVHVTRKQEAFQLVREFPIGAEELMDKFWPGPLTLVLKASDVVPSIVTAGRDTVAIRVPDHKVALELIREAKTPIAAPSANLAGKPSPTTAEHVKRDLEGRIDVILDAGSTRIGVESTVVDMTVSPPMILRPGGATYEDLKRVIVTIRLHPIVLTEKKMNVKHPRSPGMKHKHYAPNAEVIVVEGELDPTVRTVQELADGYMQKGKRVGIMATTETMHSYCAHVIKALGSRRDLAAVARNMFRLLREFDEERVDIMISEGVRLEGLGVAVMNRLRKASGYKILKVKR